MNFAILSFIIGFILQFEALFLLLPWIVGMIYGEYHVALIYLVTAAVCFILGKLLSFRHTVHRYSGASGQVRQHRDG